MNNGTCTITLEQKQIALRFGIPAVKEFSQLLLNEDGLFITDESDGEKTRLSEIGIATLLHCGYQNACLVADEKPVYKRGNFLIYVEDCIIGDQTEITEAIKCYDDSRYTKAVLQKVKEATEEAKKKLKKK